MDIIELALGAGSTPLQALREQRPVAREHSQRSFEVLLAPTGEGSLSPLERYAVALRVASLHASEPLISIYRQGMAEFVPTVPPARLEAMLSHADLLSTDPAAARPSHLAALAEAGLSAAEIVTLSQLIGFVSYQVRVVAGLALLEKVVA